MSGCRISDEWTYRSLRTLILENALVRATVLVDSGAKIHEFVYKPADRDFLWHNPRIEPRRPVFQGDVDAYWSGGLDEAIPTGHACTFNGEALPYLGEVWSLAWDYEITRRGGDAVEVHLWRATPISPLLVERWMSVRAGEAIVRMRHRVTNVGRNDFPFMWGLHPAWAVSDRHRIDLPSCEVLIEESVPGDRLGERGTRYTWPWAQDRGTGQPVDMRRVLGPDAGTSDFQFAHPISEGWLAITDTEARLGAGMVFPKEVFPVIWLWLGYGGWRGYHVAAVEAWNAYPQKLCDAVSSGVHGVLPGGASIGAETMLVAYAGLSAVERIDGDGTVHGT
ncbi:MAG: aldose epimerase family protein [Anaerolineae bacterium]